MRDLHHRQGLSRFVPAIYSVLPYGMRVLFDLVSTNALPALLFSAIAVMALIRFNAHLVEHGMTHRGEQWRAGGRPYVLMESQTLASTICKASVKALADLFNGTIRLLAAASVFPGLVMTTVDHTKILTTRHHEGCGQRPAARHKRRHKGKQEETVDMWFGWCLIALVDLVTAIPIAIKIVQIQEQEAHSYGNY